MALDVLSTCATAQAADEPPTLTLVLSIVFALYILVDSVLAAIVVFRKSAEAEATTMRAIG